MQQSQEESVFVIETCQNCKACCWHTRHDEAKYIEYFNKVSAAIVERVPNAVTMRNQIPKSYLPYDLYCNLVPNSDPNSGTFMQVPRTGSFEVSYKGMLIFSKLQGAYWPNVKLVASKCEAIIAADRDGDDVNPFLATGGAMKRGASPRKSGTYKSTASMMSSAKKSQKSETPRVAEQEPEIKPFKIVESEKFLQPVESEKNIIEPVKQDEASEKQPEPTNEEPAAQQEVEQPKVEEHVVVEKVEELAAKVTDKVEELAVAVTDKVEELNASEKAMTPATSVQAIEPATEKAMTPATSVQAMEPATEKAMTPATSVQAMEPAAADKKEEPAASEKVEELATTVIEEVAAAVTDTVEVVADAVKVEEPAASDKVEELAAAVTDQVDQVAAAVTDTVEVVADAVKVEEPAASEKIEEPATSEKIEEPAATDKKEEAVTEKKEEPAATD